MLSSVHNLVAVLRVFRLDRPELSLAEISRAVRLPKSTVNKIVRTLVAEGFLERAGEAAIYRPSLRMFEMSHFILSRIGLVREATGLVRHLAHQTGETAHLTYYENGEVIWLLRVEGPATYQLYSRIGRRAPAMPTAAGKAVLAYLEAEELQRILDRGWRKLTRKTTVDRDVLRCELERVRATGYSFQAEQVDIGIASVGAPIWNDQCRVVASVSVAGPTTHFTADAVRRLGRLTHQTALMISERLGYPGTLANPAIVSEVSH